jgi:transcriptional regulator with XRE-family HTH domain
MANDRDLLGPGEGEDLLAAGTPDDDAGNAGGGAEGRPESELDDAGRPLTYTERRRKMTLEERRAETARIAAMQRAEAQRVNIGGRIRKMRVRRMLTMEAVARVAGCSRAFLSRVERNESMPSVATLLDISKALGVPIGFFFDESEAERAVIVTPAERSRTESDEYALEELTRDVLTRKMTLQRLVVQPGETYVPKRHKLHDEASGIVISGTGTLAYDARSWAIGPGDTFYLDSPAPYRITGTSDECLEIILTQCKRTY